MRRLFAPEVVQTSNLDCGPASLKCLLEGFGIRVSYGRLREACQTSLDGTSIDAMETVANHLGLEAEQIMLPADHVLLGEANTLPCIVVVKLPSGTTHFVVLWRRHGGLLQVMDPATGRRWISARNFASELFEHTIEVAAADWRDFAISPDFERALQVRLMALGIGKRTAGQLRKHASESGDWRHLAALDAAVRLTQSMLQSKAIRSGSEARRFVASFAESSDLIPQRYWSVVAGAESDGVAKVLMRGAVLVRAKRGRAPAGGVPQEIAVALEPHRRSAGRALMTMLWSSGPFTLFSAFIAILFAAIGTVVEALLFRSLFDVNGELASSWPTAGGHSGHRSVQPWSAAD